MFSVLVKAPYFGPTYNGSDEELCSAAQHCHLSACRPDLHSECSQVRRPGSVRFRFPCRGVLLQRHAFIGKKPLLLSPSVMRRLRPESVEVKRRNQLISA
jgi:hypothetical protein